MKIIGFDCASKFKNIGITYTTYTNGNWMVERITQGRETEKEFFDQLKEFKNSGEQILICFDTPQIYIP